MQKSVKKMVKIVIFYFTYKIKNVEKKNFQNLKNA